MYAAFWECLLESVTISKGVTSIGEYAFQDNKLVGVSIPDSVTWIGHGAFYHNPPLTSVIVEGDASTIADDAFESLITMIAFDPSPAKTYASGNGYEFLNILSLRSQLFSKRRIRGKASSFNKGNGSCS